MLDAIQTGECLMQGLQYLRGLDSDFAMNENSQGFSQAHTRTGRWLIDSVGGFPDAWTEKQRRIAWQVCTYYKRTQLTFLPWAEMLEPKAPSEVAGTKVKGPPQVTHVSWKDQECLRFEFPYDKSLRTALGTAKALWSQSETQGWDKSVWYVPLKVTALEPLLNIFAEWPCAFGPGVEEAIDALWARHDKIISDGRSMQGEALSVPGLVGTLRPFQAAGVRFAAEHERVLISDEMGTGKTLQALATCAYTDSWPLLVVCPASLKLNWAKEVLRWFPHKKPVVLGGTPVRGGTPYTVRLGGKQVHVSATYDEGADVVILNYDILHSWSGTLLDFGFKMIVVDESHYIKEGTAKRTQYVLFMATGWSPSLKSYVHPGIKRRILMSGTPMLNRPKELITQLQALGRIGEIGGVKHFLERYCDPKPGCGGRTDYSGASRLDELNRRLALFTVRRLKRDVLSELPPKMRVEVPIAISNWREYDEASRDIVLWIKNELAKDEEFVSQLLAESNGDESYAWEAIESAGEKAARAEVLVRFAKLKRIIARGKMDHALAWINDFLQSGKKLVVFAWHRETAVELAGALGAPMIIGGTSIKDRDSAVEAFQNDAECRVIVLNIKAGGVGLTLTAGSDVLFCELGWSPGDMEQAEDRVHRIGQADTCTAWYLLGAGTIEEEIYELIESKRRVVGESIDGKSIIDKTLARFISRAKKWNTNDVQR